MRKLLLAIIAILSIVICATLIGIGFVFVGRAVPSAAAQSTNAPVPVADHSVSPTHPANSITPRPPRTTVATGGGADAAPVPENSTLDLLTEINFPSNDRVRLSREYKGIVASLATPAARRQYQVGDKETFWINRDMQKQNEQLTATLRYMNDVVYMWVEDGERVDENALKRSADLFAKEIYTTNREVLGSEANPGVDNDPRLHILNAHFANAAGYFSQSDTLPSAVNRQSNNKEMFYINTEALRPGTDTYDSVLAHEFAHMIHRNQNERGEASWITEGFGDLGIELNGYAAGHEAAFAQDPDLQLNAWDSQPGLSIPHYGAAYLFMSYQLNRFGKEYIRDVFSTDTTGINTIQRALDKHQTGLTFDELFADWVAANFLDAPKLGPRYSYDAGELGIRPTIDVRRYPTSGAETVHQYGTDYIQLLPNGKDVTFTFDGSDTVRAVPTDPYSGSFMWWSGRTDFSDAMMTREFDLTGVSSATLQFRAWYDLEPDYDYGYASISTDGGATWTTLKGNTTTTNDPNAANYGNAFNCKSDVGCGNPQAHAEWIQEVIDLTPYAGKKVLIRFQQITDEVYAAPGFAIDDIAIPEIGFFDDAEDGDNSWKGEGFARIDNILPQHFIVQAIEFGATPRVVPIQLDGKNRGTYTTSGFGSAVPRVVIAVSGSTPVTWETASYEYQVQ